MTYSNPKIKFTFSDGTEVTTQNIRKDSIRFSLQRLKDLDSSSNSVELTLTAQPVYQGSTLTLNGRLLTEADDIKAQVYDGSTVIFTGYVSNSKSWSLATAGNQPLTITIEDVGVRKLKCAVTDREKVLHGTVSSIVGQVLANAGVEASSDNPTIESDAYISVGANVNADALLVALLREYGYCYHFDAEGKFCISAINLNPDTEASKVLWADGNNTDFQTGDGLLRVKSGTAISLKRKISDYKSAQVQFPTLTTRQNVLVYKASGVSIGAGKWWDGNLHTVVTDGYSTIASNPTFPASAQNCGHNDRGASSSSAANVSAKFAPSGWTSGITFMKLKMKIVVSPRTFVSIVPLGKPSFRCGFIDASGKRCSDAASVEIPYSLISSGWTKTVTFYLAVTATSTPAYLVVNNTNADYWYASISQVQCTKATTDNEAAPSSVKAQDLERGKKIWWMSDLEPYAEFKLLDATLMTGLDSHDILEQDGETTGINVLVDNTTGTSKKVYTTLSAKATIVATDAEENYVYAYKDDVIDGTSPTSSTTYRYETKYVTTRAEAKALADRLGRFWTYCQNTYTFWTSEDIGLGSIVQLNDNLFSHLSAKVCVVKKTFTVKTGRETVYEYSGYAVSDIGEVTTNELISAGDGDQLSALRDVVGTTIEYALIPSDSTFAQGQDFGYDSGHVYGFTADDSYGADYTWTQGQIDPANVTSGMYVWMRTTTDGGETYRYSRLTGQKAKEKVYHHGCSTIAQIEALTLSDGDDHWFLWTGTDGTTFGTITLQKNVPYKWTTTGWEACSGIDADNASVMLSMLQDADGSSNSGVYAWFKNLIVQNAVIQNLFSQTIKLMDGGTIESESFSDATGFRLQSNGYAEFVGAKYNGNLDCPSFSSLPSSTGTSYTFSGGANAMAYALIETLSDVLEEKLYPVVDDAEIKYMRVNKGTNSVACTFYGSDTSESIGRFNAYRLGTSYTGTWTTITRTNVTFMVGAGDVFKLKAIPQQASSTGLESGQVYANPSTGALYIKL